MKPFSIAFGSLLMSLLFASPRALPAHRTGTNFPLLWPKSPTSWKKN